MEGLTPEQRARQEIDKLLKAAGWAVQDYKAMNLAAARGVAVRPCGVVRRPPTGSAAHSEGTPAGYRWAETACRRR